MLGINYVIMLASSLYNLISKIGAFIKLPGAGPVDILDLNLVITMSADGLAPEGARPSADIVLATDKHVLSMISDHAGLVSHHFIK